MFVHLLYIRSLTDDAATTTPTNPFTGCEVGDNKFIPTKIRESFMHNGTKYIDIKAGESVCVQGVFAIAGNVSFTATAAVYNSTTKAYDIKEAVTDPLFISAEIPAQLYLKNKAEHYFPITKLACKDNAAACKVQIVPLMPPITKQQSENGFEYDIKISSIFTTKTSLSLTKSIKSSEDTNHNTIYTTAIATALSSNSKITVTSSTDAGVVIASDGSVTEQGKEATKTGMYLGGYALPNSAFDATYKIEAAASTSDEQSNYFEKDQTYYAKPTNGAVSKTEAEEFTKEEEGPNKKPDDDDTPKIIAAVVISVFVVIVIIILIIYFCCCKKKGGDSEKKEEKKSSSGSSSSKKKEKEDSDSGSGVNV